MQLLRAKLYDLKLQEQNAELYKQRKDQVGFLILSPAGSPRPPLARGDAGAAGRAPHAAQGTGRRAQGKEKGREGRDSSQQCATEGDTQEKSVCR